MSWLRRLTNVFRSRRVERDIVEEQRFHLEARIDELMRAGHTRAAAEAHTTRRFGNPLRLRESSRDVKLMVWVETVFQDARLGVRLLRKDAIVTGAAVVSLGLAVGACIAAFSLVDALILRPLPVREPDRLVYLAHGDKSDLRLSTLFSYPLFERFRSAAPATIDVFSMSHQSLRQAVLPDAGGREEKLRVQWVSGNTFDVLGLHAALGRLLTIEDDRQAGGQPLVVISHSFWMRRFGGAPHVLGQGILIEQKSFQIVGVAQEGFTGTEPGMLTDAWVPNMMWRSQDLTNPHWNWLRIWGRLAPGVERDPTRALMQNVFTNFGRDTSDAGKSVTAKNADQIAVRLDSAANGPSALRSDFERPLVVLTALVGLVLLIACSNLANLMVARGAARAREMALRVSIGAGRRRLLQQVLIEGSVLAVLAAGLGLLFARLSIPFIVRMLTRSDNPVYLGIDFGWRTAAVAVVLAGLTAVLFGLAPAVRAATVAPSEVLAASGPRHASRTVLLRSLVTSQIAFSLMVLFVAALLLRSFDRLSKVDLGFDPRHVVLVTVEARERFRPEAARDVGRQLVERVRQVPGVEAASLSGWALFKGWSWGGSPRIVGRGNAQTSHLAVSAGFFRTMGIRILEGRELDPRDVQTGVPSAVVVNEAFARKYFPGEPALGQHLERQQDGRTATMTIVGIVENSRDSNIREAVGPYAYLPIADADGTLQVRTSVDPAALVSVLRDEIARVHPSLRVTDVTSQSALVGNTMLRERLLAVLSGFFGVVGLVLAAVGLYGVASYTVVRRTREIGIRLALGAGPVAVVRSTLADIAVVTILGIAGGLAGGLFFVRFIRALLFETEALSLVSLMLPVAVLTLVAFAATFRPAARAARVNPTEALRSE